MQTVKGEKDTDILSLFFDAPCIFPGVCEEQSPFKFGDPQIAVKEGQKLTFETKFVLYIFCEEKDEMPVAAIEWTAKIVYKVAKACKDTEASIQVATPNLITGADQLKASKQNVLDKAKEILNPKKDLKKQ